MGRSKRLEILDIIDKHPDELGFVFQEKTYENYIRTFTEIGEEPTGFTEEEFNKLKEYYGIWLIY